MITIQGKGVSKGIAKGPLYFFQRPDTTVTMKTVSDTEAEKARLAAAQEQSIQQLNALAEKCQDDAGEEMAILFETHAMFVEDEDFVECMTSLSKKSPAMQSMPSSRQVSSLPLCLQPWTMPTCRPVPRTSRT